MNVITNVINSGGEEKEETMDGEENVDDSIPRKSSQISDSIDVPKNEKYPCPLCTKEFQHKSGRYNHIKIHHKVKLDFGKVHCLENGCLFSCTYTTVLQQHLSTVHNIPMKYLNLEFDNYEEFEKWKQDFETGEVCRFVKKSGSRVGEAGKSMYLYCSRSGTFISHGKGRRFKKLGSAKISAHCTALIKYFEESSGHVKVTVCSTHYGHDKDYRFLRLTKNQKQHIAEKMKSGMSKELLLDSLNSTFVNKLDRIHELSKRDLNNIQTSYKIPRIKEQRKSLSNSVCVLPIELVKDDWLREIDTNVDSPVLFHKDVGFTHDHLNIRDKCLILMTKGQKDLFQKFCNNNDFYETFPVCFMISTNTNLEMLKTLFDCILTAIGPIALRALATDDNQLINQAWGEVMGPNAKFIIANRHVDAEWRKALTIVEDEACQGEIYDKLYEFIEGTDEGNEEKLVKLISELRDSIVSAPFAAHLEKNFLGNIHQWSSFYLKKDFGLRESVDFELSYGKISNLCDICYKYNKRVNHCVKGLIKLLLEFQSNRNRKVAESICEINSAHEQSLSCGIENVFPFTDGVWKVSSEDEEKMFEVRVSQCNFDDCVLICNQCDTCIHSVYCFCDNYVDGKTCIHVHLVGSMLKKLRNDSGTNDGRRWNDFDTLNDDVVNCVPEEHVESELRSKKLETLQILEDIGKILMNETDEKHVDSLSTLINDMRNNVDMVLNYGIHANKIIITKNAKLISGKDKNKNKHLITKKKSKRNRT